MPRKKLKGKIESISGSKTATVVVERVFHHPRYRKRVKVSKRYLAHLEGEPEVGQSVVIEERRPLSKRKRFEVVEVEGKPVGKQVEQERHEKHEKQEKRGKKMTRSKTKKKVRRKKK
ncbi:30S ribosomal protein S17 [Candidatus Saccharibacteria bacterium]|nr:30S ribosomal protein S17 [Candidatus Saccharibacteria bacterium]